MNKEKIKNRQELKNYRYTQKWIEGRLEYIVNYRTMINKMTSTLSETTSRGSKQIYDTEAEKVAQLNDMVNELIDIVLVENKKQKNLLKKLDNVEQPYRTILDQVYIQGKTLVTVASEMDYNYEYIKHLNGVALNKFDKVSTK